MGKMSRDKGKAGEREVAALLKSHGFFARRGVQYSGGGDSPDIVHSMEGFHVEVKRTEGFNLYAAMAQATAEKKPSEDPIVFHRKNGKQWVVVLDADVFLRMMRQYVYEPIPPVADAPRN